MKKDFSIISEVEKHGSDKATSVNIVNTYIKILGAVNNSQKSMQRVLKR